MSTKQAFNERDVAKWSAIGGLAGIGTGSALALINAINRALERRKQRLDTEENAIVVTLPKERLEQEKIGVDKPKKGTPTIRVKVSGTQSKLRPMTTPKGQHRAIDGQYGTKVAMNSEVRNAMYLTGGILGAGAAATGGYSLVTALYNKLKEKQLSIEAEEIKKRYLESILSKQGSAKAAEVTSESLAQGAKDSEGAGLTAGLLTAMMTLGTLSAGASAYLTKKLMEKKLDADIQDIDKVPRRKRIVFKAAADSNDMGSHIDYLSTLAMEICRQSGRTDLLATKEAGDALEADGYPRETLTWLAGTDMDLTKVEVVTAPHVRTYMVASTFGKEGSFLNSLYKEAQSLNYNDGVARDLVKMAAMLMPELSDDEFKVLASTPAIARLLRAHPPEALKNKKKLKVKPPKKKKTVVNTEPETEEKTE